jgi:hypothetical protein
MANFSASIFEIRTGKIVIRDIPVIDNPDFMRQVNQEGSWSISIQVGDISVPATETLRGIFAPWRFGCAIAWDDQYIAQAGPIITSQFDDDSAIISVSGGGLWSLLNRRVVIDPDYPLAPTTASSLLNLATGDLNYGPLSLHTIAKHLVQDSCARPNFALPIDFPADISGTSVRNYPIYDLAPVGQRLKELTQVENGPDVDFAPYFDPSTPGYIRFQMRIGNPLLEQDGLDLVWDYGTGLRAVSIDSNGTAMVSGSFIRGNGSERASLVAYDQDLTLVNGGWPPTEIVESYSSVTEGATLQGHAAGAIELRRVPIELWSADVRADQIPMFGTYHPGTFAVFNMIDHLWVPDGGYLQRILGFQNGSQINEIRLILQAIEGAI